jgi:hypothetical protein
MSSRTNTSDRPVAYRDDSGKHIIEPGDRFEVVGDQHLPAVDEALRQARSEGGDDEPADDSAVSSSTADEAGSRPARSRSKPKSDDSDWDPTKVQAY